MAAALRSAVVRAAPLQVRLAHALAQYIAPFSIILTATDNMAYVASSNGAISKL